MQTFEQNFRIEEVEEISPAAKEQQEKFSKERPTELEADQFQEIQHVHTVPVDVKEWENAKVPEMGISAEMPTVRRATPDEIPYESDTQADEWTQSEKVQEEAAVPAKYAESTDFEKVSAVPEDELEEPATDEWEKSGRVQEVSASEQKEVQAESVMSADEHKESEEVPVVAEVYRDIEIVRVQTEDASPQHGPAEIEWADPTNVPQRFSTAEPLIVVQPPSAVHSPPESPLHDGSEHAQQSADQHTEEEAAVDGEKPAESVHKQAVPRVSAEEEVVKEHYDLLENGKIFKIWKLNF